MQKESYDYTRKYIAKRISEGWVRRTFFLPKEIMDKLANAAKKLHLEYKLNKMENEKE